MQLSRQFSNLESASTYLTRIESALFVASQIAEEHIDRKVEFKRGTAHDIVTAADRQISRILREQLLQPDEGWLSEEDPDDQDRLSCDVLWVVDPIDGTREFVDGIKEWSISVGLVISGHPVAGGVINPATKECFLGSLSTGVTYNGKPCKMSERTSLDGATVLASRREYTCGEWQRFEGERFDIRPVGSIAYKLALVAAGLGDATWTLRPKHEWDVAAGVALVHSAGGRVCCTQNAELAFNRDDTLFPGMIAGSSGIWEQVIQLIA